MSIRKESIEEENLNVITHAFGLLLSIVALYFLLEKSFKNNGSLEHWENGNIEKMKNGKLETLKI